MKNAVSYMWDVTVLLLLALFSYSTTLNFTPTCNKAASAN